MIRYILTGLAVLAIAVRIGAQFSIPQQPMFANAPSSSMADLCFLSTGITNGLMLWHTAETPILVYGSNNVKGFYTQTGTTNGEPTWISRNLQVMIQTVPYFGTSSNRINDINPSAVTPPAGFYWYATNGPNGRAAWYHTNSTADANVWVTQHASGAAFTNQPLYYFVVMRTFTYLSAVGPFSIIVGANTGDNRPMVEFQSGTLHLYNSPTGPFSAAVPTMTNWMLWTFGYNGASSFVRTNGVLLVSGTAGVNGIDNMQIFSNADEGRDIPGALATLAGYGNVTLTTNEIQTIENCIMSTYGLPLPP